MIPPKLTKRADGGVMVDVQTYIILPLNHTLWTSEIISAACNELAKLSFKDYDDLIKLGVFALRATKQSLAAYCDSMGYERPRFWFSSAARMRFKAKSFGGRPSVMRQIEAEMVRRANIKFLAPKLRAEAKELRRWAEDNIDPEKQIPQVASIEDALRERYVELLQTGCSDHKT